MGLFIGFLLLGLTFLDTGCAMENAAIFDIPLPYYGRTECSPNVGYDFAGLMIDGPRIVSLSKNEVLPICGTYRVSNTVNNLLGSNLIEETTLVFVRGDTRDPISFNLIPDKEPLDGARRPLTNSIPELAPDKILNRDQIMVNVYFNIDVFTFHADFPREPARYLVYATNRGIKSNVIEIDVVD